MNDRIKLAEAMGWEKHPTRDYWRERSDQPFTGIDELPDPLTDANDDYAVLEWARENEMLDGTTTRFGMRIYLGGSHDYQVGDYARAALKVIE